MEVRRNLQSPLRSDRFGHNLFHSMRGHGQDGEIRRLGKVSECREAAKSLNVVVARIDNVEFARKPTGDERFDRSVTDGTLSRRAANERDGSWGQQWCHPVGMISFVSI